MVVNDCKYRFADQTISFKLTDKIPEHSETKSEGKNLNFSDMKDHLDVLMQDSNAFTKDLQ